MAEVAVVGVNVVVIVVVVVVNIVNIQCGQGLANVSYIIAPLQRDKPSMIKTTTQTAQRWHIPQFDQPLPRPALKLQPSIHDRTLSTLMTSLVGSAGLTAGFAKYLRKASQNSSAVCSSLSWDRKLPSSEKN